MSEDGTRVVSGSDDWSVKVWTAVPGACLRTLLGHSGSVTSVAITGDGARVASGNDDTLIKVWEVESGVCLRTLEGHTIWGLKIAMSRDGAYIVSGEDNGNLHLWDVESGACIRTLNAHASSVTSVAISEDGGRVVSASLELDETVKAWDPPPRPERAVALAMGHHARLGAESLVLALEEGLLRLLAQHAAAGAWGGSVQ
jgi:WD40 repeat protein